MNFFFIASYFFFIAVLVSGCTDGLAQEVLPDIDLTSPPTQQNEENLEDFDDESSTDDEEYEIQENSHGDVFVDSADAYCGDGLLNQDETQEELPGDVFTESNGAYCGDGFLNKDWEQCDGNVLQLCSQLNSAVEWECSVTCDCVQK